MTRGKRRKTSDDQLELLGVRRPRLGRVERSVNAAIRRGYADGWVDKDLDAGMCAVARSLARMLDGAVSDDDRWAVARLTGELRETLRAMRLEPTSRGAGGDEFADLVASLSAPE